MSAGNLTAFILYVNLFLSPLQKITNLLETYQRGMAAFTRFAEIMSIKPDVEDKPDAAVLPRPRAIYASSVGFRYNDSKNVAKRSEL